MFGSRYKYSAVKVGTVTSQKTQEYASRMNENVIQPTRTKVQEGTLLTDMSTSTKGWASRMATSTAKGWRDLTSSLVEDTSQSEHDQLQPSQYQDMPLMTEGADRSKTTEGSSLLDLDQSDTPLLLSGASPPAADDDEQWNDWGNTDWDQDKPAKKTATPPVTTDEDGWEDWGNQKDLLIDFGDGEPISSGSSSKRTTATTKKSQKSSQKVTSLEETWDDADGWDDAAWEAVEREVGKTPATLKSSKAD